MKQSTWLSLSGGFHWSPSRISQTHFHCVTTGHTSSSGLEGVKVQGVVDAHTV